MSFQRYVDRRMSTWMFLFHVQLNKIEQTCFSSPELTKTHSKSLLETKAQGLLHCYPTGPKLSKLLHLLCIWTFKRHLARRLCQHPPKVRVNSEQLLVEKPVAVSWCGISMVRPWKGLPNFLEMIRLLCHGPWISTEFCHLLWPWPMESSGTWEHKVFYSGNIVQCGEFIIFTHLGFGNPLGSAPKIIVFSSKWENYDTVLKFWGTLFLHKPVCWLLICYLLSDNASMSYQPC